MKTFLTGFFFILLSYKDRMMKKFKETKN